MFNAYSMYRYVYVINNVIITALHKQKRREESSLYQGK